MKSDLFPFSAEYLREGIALEEARRAPPYDAKGFPVNYEEANKKYVDWLTLHGRLILEQALNNARK